MFENTSRGQPHPPDTVWPQTVSGVGLRESFNQEFLWKVWEEHDRCLPEARHRP